MNDVGMEMSANNGVVYRKGGENTWDRLMFLDDKLEAKSTALNEHRVREL